MSYLNQALKGLICSASGWRKILRYTRNNEMQDYDLFFFFCAVKSFIALQKEEQQKKRLRIAVACDTRKSSPEILSLTLNAINAEKQRAALLGITAIPAALSYGKCNTDALLFITASHNPQEYNGIKFCEGSGRVLTPEKNRKLFSSCMKKFKEAMLPSQFSSTQAQVSTLRRKRKFHALSELNTAVSEDRKKEIALHYEEVLRKSALRGIDFLEWKKKIGKQISKHGKLPAIVWDVNGGARCGKIDAALLSKHGVFLKKINGRPGIFAHEIIPEAAALRDAAKQLHKSNSQELQKAGKQYFFAMVSDCDGDRGNTVLYDFRKRGSIELAAQEIFALVMKIELAWQRWIEKDARIAVVVNDASSLRVESIAQDYDIAVFRSEVGEANVLALAERMRKKNYSIPLSGEASNGGIIMHPSYVRDPLHTCFSFLKALLFFDELFPKLAKRVEANPLLSILRSLPKAHSTGTEDKLAKFQIPAIPSSTLMKIIVLNAGKLLSAAQGLPARNIDAIKIVNHYGSKSRELSAGKSYTGLQGGLTVYLREENKNAGMLWIRKSSTEPVLRVSADITGKRARVMERALIKLWRKFLHELLNEV